VSMRESRFTLSCGCYIASQGISDLSSTGCKISHKITGHVQGGGDVSKQKHTAEPWSALGSLNRPVWYIVGADAGKIGEMGTEVDIHRVISCVNACDGLDPTAIKELLETARSLNYWGSSPPTLYLSDSELVSLFGKLRNAIGKIEGEQKDG